MDLSMILLKDTFNFCKSRFLTVNLFLRFLIKKDGCLAEMVYATNSKFVLDNKVLVQVLQQLVESHL